MNRIMVALLLICGMQDAALPATAREPDVRGFKTLDLAGYTIISNDEGKVRAVPGQVARIDDVLTKLLNRSNRAPASPTFIALLPDALWRRYLEPGPAISGEFIAGRFASYIIIKNPGDASLLGESIRHQYSHWFLQTQTPGVHPLWFDEGLAGLMAGAEIRTTKVIVGYLPSPEINEVVQGAGDTFAHAPHAANSPGWIPMAQLFRLDRFSPEYRQRTWSTNVHVESWALMHRALIFDPKFGQQVFAYLDALTAGQSIDEAAKASFGVALDDLDSPMYSYLANTNKVVDFTVAPARIVPLPAGRAMAKPAALQFIADVMLSSGYHADRLTEVSDALQRAAPDSAAAFALRMRVAALEHDDATLDRMSQDSRTSSPEFARGAGLALFERVRAPQSGDTLNAASQDRFAARAHELLQSSLRSKPDDAEATWASSLLSARLKKDLPLAVLRAQAMSEKLPYSAELRIAIAALKGASGSTDEMRRSLIEARQLSMLPSARAELEAMLVMATAGQ